MNAILKRLTEVKAELRNPFPTEDFRTEFLALPDEIDFYEDFRYYCVNIDVKQFVPIVKGLLANSNSPQCLILF